MPYSSPAASPGSPDDTLERGYDVDLVQGTVPENLLCSSCRKVLRNPFQSSCGHRFCAKCLTELFRNSMTPLCPIDRTLLIKEDNFHDVFAEREVLALVVKCPSTRAHEVGCEWTGEIRTLKSHGDVCDFAPRPCPNGCQKMVSNSYLSEHVQEQCAARLVECEYCQKKTPMDLMAKHKESCSEVPVNCPNSCTTERFPRSQMVEHLRVCPKQIVKCFYSSVGCDFEGERGKLPDHHEANLAFHLQISYKQAQDNKAMIEFLAKQNSMLAEKCASLEDGLVRLMAKVEQNVTATTASPPSSKPKELDALKEVVSAQEKRLASMERSVAFHDVQLSEFDIRQNIQETKMANGVLVWKISDFKRHQQDAISGKTPSLYSPPFYTSPAGYKVCARLYPNGDGVGRGTHLSFFFVVMKGEFDTLLPWPFQQKVSLILMDQNRINPRDVIETFRPDAKSSSFQRPKNDMNVASGCPLFVPLSSLNNSSYLHDDALYLKVIIHPHGLQAPDDA